MQDKDKNTIMMFGLGILIAWLLSSRPKTIISEAILNFLPDQQPDGTFFNNIGYGVIDGTGNPVIPAGTRSPRSITIPAGIYTVDIRGGD
jgi:hypothetical protein